MSEERLTAIEARLNAHAKVLATLESRVSLILETCRLTQETVTRLTLKADNGRRLALAHGDTLLQILKALESDKNDGPSA